MDGFGGRLGVSLTLHEVTGGLFWQVSEVWLWKVKCLEVDLLVLHDLESTELGLKMLDVPLVLLAGFRLISSRVQCFQCETLMWTCKPLWFRRVARSELQVLRGPVLQA